MSIKLALLKSGETIISDIKELVTENSETNDKQVYAYIFSKPQKVCLNTPLLISEEVNTSESSVKVSLSSWILLSNDEDILVPTNWVVTIVEPIDSVRTMYEEQTNGK
jgi:hypothetical protein